MADIALEYDDLLDGGGSPWKRRLIIAGVAAVVAGVAAFFAWDHWMRGGTSAAAPAFTEATVSSGNITKTISTSATVSAEKTSNLNFTTSGKVTKVDVTLGQQVKQGDVLAEIDPTDAQNSLKTAQASLASAQARLQTLLQGSTAAQLASADQSLASAQANYDKAVRALQTLQQPPDPTEVETDQQAVTTAQAQLQSAQAARAKLDSDAQAAVQAAQQGVQKAQLALTAAQQAADSALQDEQNARGALFNAETAYCPDASVSFCSVQAAPISSADAATLVTVTGGSDATRAQLAQAVLSADGDYRKAATAYQTAANGVTTAQTALDGADAALSDAESQPTAAQVASANAAIGAAQAQLDAANKKLGDLLAGPTQNDLADARSAVDTAAAALKSAQASRDQAYAGSTAADIQAQRSAVQQAQVQVDNAQKAVDDTKLKAPFDGTVAALNIQVGDTAGAGGSTASGGASSGAAVVLNTPDALVLNLTVAESDYPSVKAGDTGIATFEALPNEFFPFVVDSLGVNPTTTQGVVTYQAKAHLVTGPQAASILQSLRGSAAGGFNRQGQAGAPAGGAPGAGATPGAGRTPRADRTPPAGGTATAGGGGGFRGTSGAQLGQNAAASRPAPGMNATVTIIVDSRTNVLMVPSKAVQTKDRQTVVTVKDTDGTTKDVVVTTGLSDNTNTEITSGLTEGQTVEVPGGATTTTTTQALPATGGFGGGGGGGFFRGGGGGGGRSGD